MLLSVYIIIIYMVLSKNDISTNHRKKYIISKDNFSNKPSVFIEISHLTNDGKIITQINRLEKNRIIKKKITDRHIHENIEIGVILSGNGKLYYDDKSYDIKAGDGYFIDCMTHHFHYPYSNNHLENLWIHIKYETLESLSPNDRYIELIHPFLLLKTDKITPVIKNSIDFYHNITKAYQSFYSNDKYGYFLAWSYIIRGFIEINRYIDKYSSVQINNQYLLNRETLNDAIQFIHNNYISQITLKNIADYCFISTSKLSKLFKNYMYISPIDYRNKLRINMAIELLNTTSKTISEIAFTCGFEDLAHFRKIFKKFTKHKPSDIRKFTK